MSQLRFADSMDGWAFHPDLWVTHDGSTTWHRVALPGLSPSPFVSALETAGGLVHSAVIDSNFGVRIETSAVAAESWHLSPTAIPAGAGPVPVTEIVLQAKAGWIVQVDRTVIGGARLSNGQWVQWQPPCSQVNGPASLAASSSTDLFVVCDEGIWGPSSVLGVRDYVSRDGGVTFRRLGQSLPASAAGVAGVATPNPPVAVIVDGSNMMATFDGGATWGTVYRSANQTPTYVGFETAEQGVAIVENRAGAVPAGMLLRTVDGGRHWSAIAV
ncbi:MAG: hypothetical protein JF886_04280 [Candidatus Dormibacteraeota bacterium]|uniref:Photosynthesis system II assembly factor Ycf48/Hcf136-like domain-containing protein n=1 Tax=Candidatus Aeolococcus gillhamiae TaxID=3127015 RepID=A0A934JW10_9BACT|nr:hypothetical protein [Candidatus Dormibacteraeota bacterium]